MLSLFNTLSKEQARQLSPITLAFVGDDVFSLYIRESVVINSDHKPADLQKITSAKVSAHGQNVLLEKIEGFFNEDESAVFHRGRNAKKATKSKNASVAEYNRSTGLEAVFGYLYLSGQNERIAYLIEAGNEN
jgi:ribonuclease-3 family protein